MLDSLNPSPVNSSLVSGPKLVARAIWWSWALFFLVLGSRLVVFAYAGSPLPYYDQWIAEYNNMLLGAVGGNGVLSTLFVPHNEHLPVIPRLLCLIGYLLNGYWDVEFLAICSAFVRAFVAMFAFRLLSSGSTAAKGAIFMACVVVFAAPLSGYNQLCGFQVCFYFAELALLWSIWTVLRWTSPWRSGLTLVFSLVIGLLSLASAIVIPFATLIVHLAVGERRRGFWIAWATSLGMAALFAFISASANSPPISLKRGYEIMRFFSALLSWPLLNSICGIVAAAFVALGLVRVLRTSLSRSQALAAAFGLSAFGAGNALLIAISRTPSTLHMRHWETLALLPLGLFAILLGMAQEFPGRRKFLHSGVVALAVVYLFFFAALIGSQSWPYIRAAHDDRDEAVTHYRRLLLSGDIVVRSLWMNDRLARRNYSFFDDSINRFALHPAVARNINGAPLSSLSLLAPELIPTREPSFVSGLVRAVKNAGWMFFLLGGFLALAALIFRAPEPLSRAPSSSAS